MTDSLRNRFLNKVCPWDWVFALMFGVNVVLLILLILTFLLAEQSTETIVVSAMAGVFILASLVLLGPIVKMCRTRDEFDSRLDEE